MVNSLEEIYKRKKEVKMATHFILYLYVGIGGFRWPVAYYATNNINAHQIYLTFWELMSVLQHYGFKVVYAMMDGSSNNRNFMHLMLPFANIRSMKFTTHNPFNHKEKMIMVKDIKHCLKKIRNSLLSSSVDTSARRTLKWNGHLILWEHFREVYNYNCKHYMKLYEKLTREHVELNAQSKMRNHLAIDCLGEDMCSLFEKYQETICDRTKLKGTIALLKQTSVLVRIFTNRNGCFTSLYDTRVNEILSVLKFFHDWEDSYSSKSEMRKHLITQQTWEDIDSALYGFLSVLEYVEKNKCRLNPGFFNQDICENVFAQIRSIRKRYEYSSYSQSNWTINKH